jgi:hypothetical protein
MTIIINKFTNQGEDFDENIHLISPVKLFRVTWKDEKNNHHEFWTSSNEESFNKKYEIDHSESLTYINFESWYGYPNSVEFKKNILDDWNNHKQTIELNNFDYQLRQSKFNFLKKYNSSETIEQGLSDSINSSVGHNKLYTKNLVERERKEITTEWCKKLKKLSEKYIDKKPIKTFENDILNLQKIMNKEFGEKIYFKLSHSQKSLSIFLKHLYCLNIIEIPPCCPIDSIVLRKTESLNKTWTTVDDLKTHRDRFSYIQKESKKLGMNVCHWELITFQS